VAGKNMASFMFENIKAKQYLAQLNEVVESSSREIPIIVHLRQPTFTVTVRLG